MILILDIDCQIFILDRRNNMNQTAQKAISAALKGNWKEAETLNKEILKNSPKDIDALNRLARAYIELGKINKAKQTSKKVLEIDAFNSIATKSLEKWKTLKKKELDTKGNGVTKAELFLEEPGKTKIIDLVCLGDEKVITKLDSGDEIVLKPGGHRVSLLTQDRKLIGRLPDDIASRIRKLTRLGNKYQVLVKSIQPNCVKVFIRETKRSSKIKDISTFSSDRIDYVAFTPPELVHKKENILKTEDQGQED